ncbi:MAG: hypothetical protein IPG49_15335 [Proteobacteria bacterium]|nr:hypothetical protein [Pseudomonadota bacterium]
MEPPAGIEEWLRAGRLTVNGSVAKLGDRAGPGDAFLLDGQPLLLQQAGAAGAGEGPPQKPAPRFCSITSPPAR